MSQTLRTITIPFQGGRAILPNSLVVEVLPYAKPLRIEKAPNWVVGSILWKSVPIPLVSFERLIFRTSPGVNAHARIVIVNALQGDHKLREFGFLGTEPPQLSDIDREAISDNESNSIPTAGVLRWVSVHGREMVIPDLDVIEQGLLRALRA